MLRKKKAVDAVQTLVIQFVGKRRELDKRTGKQKLVIREAPTQLINGQRIFDLPSDEIQKKGFSHPDAERLLQLYPKDFKVKNPKGKKQ